jgi:hypothetical protein
LFDITYLTHSLLTAKNSKKTMTSRKQMLKDMICNYLISNPHILESMNEDGTIDGVSLFDQATNSNTLPPTTPLMVPNDASQIQSPPKVQCEYQPPPKVQYESQPPKASHLSQPPPKVSYEHQPHFKAPVETIHDDTDLKRPENSNHSDTHSNYHPRSSYKESLNKFPPNKTESTKSEEEYDTFVNNKMKRNTQAWKNMIKNPRHVESKHNSIMVYDLPLHILTEEMYLLFPGACHIFVKRNPSKESAYAFVTFYSSTLASTYCTIRSICYGENTSIMIKPALSKNAAFY